MVWTTIGFSESQDNAALADVNALADRSVTNIGVDSILVPKWASKLAAALAVGVNITQARVVAPSLDQFNNVDIGGINRDAEPLSPTPMMTFFRNPIPLTVNEQLGYQAAEDGAGAQISSGLLWLMDKLDPMATLNGKRLPIRTIRFTGAETLVPNTWDAVIPVPQQTLKAGKYQAVGLRTLTAGGVASRYNFVGENTNHRPGCPAYDVVSDIENPLFRMGVLGSWGEFEHNQIPQIEVWSRSADTVQEFFMDLVKIE